MSVNQIDDIIDQTLDQLYLEELNSNETIKILTEENVINFVEYFDGINNCIRDFTNKIDKSKIQELVNSKENTQRILDIITRYVAYYIFLYIGFYYTGTFKDFRNNLIQFSKLQEKSLYSIINFFDTENNYRILTFYKMMRDVIKIILMTDLQKKSIDINEMKDALAFLDKIGEDNVNEYFLIITPDPEKNDDATIQLNVHSIIKTIVFGELYQFQERHVIFGILSEIEENESEFTYIDIVVMADAFDFDSIRKIFLGYKGDTEKMANNLFELLNATDSAVKYRDNEKINRLINFYGVIPIVDDFLRYHKDSIKLEGSEPVPIIFSNTANKQNIQLLLKSQQRKKKENTKAQMIINKIDAIQSLYSNNVKNNPAVYDKIKQLFFEPYIHRKMVLHNYLEELEILNKMHKMETYITSIDEYYLELLYAVNHAYFNFKDFLKYGNHVNIEYGKTINMLRYCNIEHLNKGTTEMLDVRTGAINNPINVVGLALGPFNGNYIQCVTKDKLIDIRSVTINYTKNKQKKSVTSNNGYKMFIKCFKRIYIDTITIVRDPKLSIIVNTDKIKILNPDLFDKVIYWAYDVTTDIYKSKTYELGSQKSLLAGISDSENSEIDFQEKIKQMNSDLYDKIVKTLKTKLNTLIKEHISLSIFETYTLVYLFSNIYGLNMSEKEVNIIVRENYIWEKKDKINITQVTEKDIIQNPEIVLPPRPTPIIVKIDITDPLHPKSAKAITKKMDQEMPEEAANFGEFIENSKCKHEIEWDDIVKLYESGDAYKSAINKFIAMYAIQSNDSSFVCKICGQTLQVLQYVQDGKFDNNVQKYVSSYSSSDIKLKDMKEYVAYVKTLKHLKKSTKRVSFLMGINIVSGSGPMVKQKQTSLTKQMIDLLIKHNQMVLRKNIDNDVRLDFYAKNFGIDKRFSSVYFFKLNDNLFSPEQRQIIQADADITKLEINNITLYVSLIILTELNGSQIFMMNTDKYLNIYFFEKYGKRLFDGLLLKRNITDNETIPLLSHPVFCYCIYVVAYVLYTYLIWKFASDEKSKKTFNPAILKNIIHSLCELLNSILIECEIQNSGGTINDYVYLLFSNKFYSQLNGIYSDNSVIAILQKLHSKYSDAPNKATTVEKIQTNYIGKDWHIVSTPYKITVFKVSTGVAYDRPEEVEYPYDKIITSKIICDSGDFHSWIWKNNDLVCRKCGALYSKVDTIVDKLITNYYFYQDKNLKKECEKEMDNKESPLFNICSNHKEGELFSHTYIDKFNTISEKEKLNRIEEQITSNIEEQKMLKTQTTTNEALIENLYAQVEKKYNKTYGIINDIVDDFIKTLATLLGTKTNLNIHEEAAPDQEKPMIEKNPYPIYLNDNVYIIDHSYDQVQLPSPIIMLESENKIIFKENHQFFKTDVYYYADNRTVQINVFYDAITFKLLGYKAKHKDFVLYKKSNQFLKVNQSIKNKLLVFSYRNKYIDITDAINKAKIDDINLTYYEIINELIEKHILTTRNTIDIISRMIYKIKNYVVVQKAATFLESSKEIDKLIDRYVNIFSNKIRLGENDDAFDDWRNIRNMFKYEEIDWSKTNIVSSIYKDGVFTYVSTDTINYYDVASTVMMYYLIDQLSKILNDNPEKVTKTNITKLYIDLVNYVYSINNIDEIKNTSDIRRFEYILKGSPIAVDMLRRGQGIAAVEKMEKQLINIEADQTIEEITGEPTEPIEGDEMDSDDLEDIREEAEALDVEADEYDDDDNVEYESE
uniref:Uncharacterized protein n=1 Tax=viral metagenome TaxID=1070528 RepID=A0A6C0C9V6_9ZZZZ